MSVENKYIEELKDYQIIEYYKNDLWVLKEHEKFKKLSNKQKEWFEKCGMNKIDFGECLNNNIKEELKEFSYFLIENKIQLTTYVGYIKAFVPFIKYINYNLLNINSIMDIDKNKLIKIYELYLDNSNQYSKLATQKRITKDMTIKDYKGKSTYIRYIIAFYEFIEKNNKSEYIKEVDKDVWDVRNLPIKVEIPITRPRYIINFTDIYQQEIRSLFKKYTYERLKTKALNTCIDDLKGIKLLSKFLILKYPEMKSLIELDREIIEEFMSYVRTENNLEQRTIVSRIGSVRTFFEISQLLGLNGAPTKTLITPKDYSCKTKTNPRFFTDEELKQINENMKELPIQISRMLFVIENVGMRISDLCALKKDCLSTDTKGEYLIRYFQVKSKRYNQVPISVEVAEVIKESIKSSELEFGVNIKYVFSQSKDNPVSTETFSYHLNQLTYKYNILDRKGDILRIESHAFRGTVATQYANLGLSINIIRMLLGQKSTGAIKHYVQMHEVTIVDAMKEIIDNQNNLIENIGKVDNMEFIYEEDKNLTPLPNGVCGKPISEGKCTHANACYSCRMFKANKNHLELYKYHLKEAKNNIEIAEINGFERILQVNKELEENLTKIIKKIEESI